MLVVPQYFERAEEYAQRSHEELKAFREKHDTFFTDIARLAHIRRILYQLEDLIVYGSRLPIG